MDGFFGIGIGELFLIAVVALVVLGPERLPGALREVAKFIRSVRNMTNELTSQFGDEFKVLEDLNPQKILRDLAEDPDEKAKTAAKSTATKTTAATKPTTTTKPAAKPATPKPASTSPKPATSTTTATASKPATPKSTGAAVTSKPETATSDTEIATVEEGPAAAVAGVEATTGAESLADASPVAPAEAGQQAVIETSAQAAPAVEYPGVDVYESKSASESRVEPSILPPELGEQAPAGQSGIGATGSLDLADTPIGEVTSGVDVLAEPAVDHASTEFSPESPPSDAAETPAGINHAGEATGEVGALPQPSRLKSTSVNGAHVNGAATENEA